jgi:hypothetical protein
MSHGYSARYVDHIEEQDLEKIGGIKEKLKDLKKLLKTHGVDFSDFAECISVEEVFNELEEPDNKVINTMLDSIKEEFKQETGLTIGLDYHDSEVSGSCHDDIDGYFWFVEGMYELTPEGEKMQKVVRRSTFVSFS